MKLDEDLGMRMQIPYVPLQRRRDYGKDKLGYM